MDQYRRVKQEYKLAANGNWVRSIKNLIYKKSRRHLNINALLDILYKQEYKCALSGVPLTCEIYEDEISRTNISIDRIDRTKGYELDNIRFVCMAVNTMRWVMSDAELINWCSKILENRKVTT